MKALGLLSEDVDYFPHPTTVTSWNSLSETQREEEARAMEIYAAMVDDLDTHIGRLLDYLKTIDEYENTVVIFISDNGPAVSTAETMPPILREWYEECCDTSYENMGKEASWVFYGVQWAVPGAGHLRATKGHVSEEALECLQSSAIPRRL